MGDWLSREQRSRNMASIRSTGNRSTEQRFARLLRLAGIRGWRRHLSLPGRPDFAFPSARVAVFIDGCFWHGCPRCYRAPEGNARYWEMKRAANRARDRRVARELRARGWAVLRFWEHALKAEGRAERVTRALAALLRARCAVPMRVVSGPGSSASRAPFRRS